MRDPTVLLWPDNFAPFNSSITIDRPVFKGPKPLDGREQTVFSSAGGWLISYDGIPIYGSRYRTFRAVWASITGFAKAVYVKPEYTADTVAKRYGITSKSATFSQIGTIEATINWGSVSINWGDGSQFFWGADGTGSSIFDDGASFSQSTGDCLLLASASRGATTISVLNSRLYPLSAGDYFEINGRIHLLRGIDGNTWNIWPPLRSSYDIGTVLEIDDPRMLAYVTSDSRINNLNIDMGRISKISVDFIEASW